MPGGEGAAGETHLNFVENSTVLDARLLSHKLGNLEVMRLRSNPLGLASPSAAHGCGAGYQVGGHLPQRGADAPNDVGHQRLQ